MDFLWLILNFFRQVLPLKRYERKMIKNRRFWKGVGQFGPKFQVEGDIPHQPFFLSENQDDRSFIYMIFHGYISMFGFAFVVAFFVLVMCLVFAGFCNCFYNCYTVLMFALLVVMNLIWFETCASYCQYCTARTCSSRRYQHL